jgi:hypothetical protein
MTFRGLLSTMLLALALSACQTAGGPTPGAAALLAQQGFKPESIEEFNKDLQPDDIRTDAVYTCDTAACGGLALVLFGSDPEGSITQKDLASISFRSRTEGVRAANRILRSAGVKDFRVVSFAAPPSADGAKIYTLGLLGSILRDRVYGRMTILYRNGSGRLVIIFAANRALVDQFGAPEMLR